MQNRPRRAEEGFLMKTDKAGSNGRTKRKPYGTWNVQPFEVGKESYIERRLQSALFKDLSEI